VIVVRDTSLGMPSRIVDERDRGTAGIRGPGTRMPVRLSGSLAETRISFPVGSLDAMSRRRSSASGRANCSPTGPATNRPPRTSPRASKRLSAQRTSRHGRANDSRTYSSRRAMPQRSRSWVAIVSASSSGSNSSAGEARSADQRPPASVGEIVPPRGRRPSEAPSHVTVRAMPTPRRGTDLRGGREPRRTRRR